MDTNGDRLINSADAGWGNLKVWVDANADGVFQAGELHTLNSLGIVQLNLSATASATWNNGNLLGMISSFVTADGKMHQMADVWFATNSSQLSTLTTGQIAAMTTSQLAALTTAQVSTLTTTQVATLTTAQVVALDQKVGTIFADTELQKQVGGLLAAMSAFNQSQSAVSSGAGNLSMNTRPNADTSAGTLGVSVNVAGIVGALQQFNLNANLGAGTLTSQSVTPLTSASISPALNTINNGILAVSK